MQDISSYEYVGKIVEIELNKELTRIYYKGKEIALHPRGVGRGKFSTNDSHYPKYKRFSETEYQEKYQVKMAEIGEYAEQLFLLAVGNQPKNWNRIIQGILSLKKSYPPGIINLACRRALAYGVHQYQTIRNICRNGSYNLPVEFCKESYECCKN